MKKGRPRKTIWPEGVPHNMELETAGHSHNLVMHIGKSSCGIIDDGIGFHFGNQGGWVVSRADLEKALKLCAEVRAANE